jgi:predicted TIM-barrel fold metal-dependent hydrolase
MFRGFAVLDCHGHMSTPPEFRAYAYNLIALRSPRAPRLSIDESRLRLSLGRHLSMLDERNIDVQLISPRPVAMMHWEQPFIVHNWTRVTNDVIKQICDLEPQRFIGVAQLPQTREEDTSHCLPELLRSVNELGFVGATVNPDPGADRTCPGLNDPYWFPLYEAAEDLQVPLIIHPSISRDPRLAIIPSSYQYNNLTEEALAMLLLKHSDVFDRYPRLRVVVCHGGGALPRMLEGAPSSGQAGGGQAMTQGPTARDEQEDEGGRDFKENLFVDSCAYNPNFLEAVIKQYGAGNVVFGTEIPGSGTSALNVQTGRPSDDLLPVLESFAFLSDDELEKILHGNFVNVFPRATKSPALA